MDTIESRLTPGDVSRYLLAYGIWILLSAVSAPLMLVLRSGIAPLVGLSLARNPYYKTATVEMAGVINSVDRLGLIVLGIIWVVWVIFAEEYVRSAVAQVRERRLRARLSTTDAKAESQTPFLYRWGLDILARRVLRLALFPAALGAVYLLLQAVLWLQLRA